MQYEVVRGIRATWNGYIYCLLSKIYQGSTKIVEGTLQEEGELLSTE